MAAVLISITCSIFPTSAATFFERTPIFVFKAPYALALDVIIDRRFANLGLALTVLRSYVLCDTGRPAAQKLMANNNTRRISVGAIYILLK